MDMLERRKDGCNETARASRLLVAVAAGLLSVSALAKEPRYTMTVIKDESQGRRVLEGDYDAAIDRITAARHGSRDPFSSQTNLCVAYTKAGYLDKADEACNAAVAIVRERRQSQPRTSSTFTYIDAGIRADLAVALSNRGVLNAARGDTDKALADFRASLELDAGLSAPAINIARLDTNGRGTN